MTAALPRELPCLGSCGWGHEATDTGLAYAPVSQGKQLFLEKTRDPQERGQNQKLLPHPCLLKAQKRVELLRNPCILGGPQQRGTQPDVATSPCLLGAPTEGATAMQPLPSRGPKRGRNSYIAVAISGIPNKGQHNHTWLSHPCLLGGHKRAELLRKPCILGDPQEMGQNEKWLPHPCLLGGRKRVELLHNPCILGGPQQRETQSSPRTPHLLSPVTGLPCLAMAPGRAPAPRAGEAGATAGPDPARSAGGP